MTFKRFVLTTLVALALAALAASGASAQSYASQYLGHLDGGWTVGRAVNDDGLVVGSSRTAAGETHAFAWQIGATADLGTLPGDGSSEARAVNRFGQAAGYSAVVLPDGSSAYHAVLWQNGAVLGLGGLPGGNGSIAHGINDAGQVVGEATDASGFTHAFLWDSATGIHDLGTLGGGGSRAYAISSSGQVVGEAQAADGASYPFLWTPSAANATTGTMAALDPSPGYASDINDAGDAVGVAGGQGFRWDSQGVAHWLEVLPGYYASEPSAINNAGEVAGDCWVTLDGGISGYDDNGVPYGGGSYTYYVAAVWDSAGAVRDPSTLISSGPVEVGSLMQAVAINNPGQVVTPDYLLTPSPAPPRPLNLVATPAITQVSLAWQASSGATSYRVYRATAGGSYTLLATAPSASHTDAAVTPGTTYRYVVTALNAAAESGPSNEAVATPQVWPPGWLNAAGGDGKVTLAWGPSPNATSYRVKCARIAGGPYTILATGVTSPGYEDRSVVNGTRYFYVVTAVNGPYESASSPEAAATPRTPPAAPTGLSASGPKHKVALKWTQSTSPGVVANRIYRSTTSGGTYTLLAEIGAGTTYTDTSASGGASYSYRVTAVNDNGQESPFSNAATAKPH